MLKTYATAIRDETIRIMDNDRSVILIGEGVPDPKAVFGTTKGIEEHFPTRVFDMPVSENGLLGVCVGAAINGIKPIMVHQRIDFLFYAADQLINNAAKWYSMFGGRAGSVPMVIRAVIGRGWGQGNQHSQNVAHLFATIPGLKVFCPFSAKNAASGLREAVQDKNPVLYLEHRWLHNTESEVGESDEFKFTENIKEGSDITIISWSYITLEVIKASNYLEKLGIKVEIINLNSIKPIDFAPIRDSVTKTGRLIVVEEAWEFNGLSGEIICKVMEEDIFLDDPPIRMNLSGNYSPSSHYLTKDYYIRASHIFSAVLSALSIDSTEITAKIFEELKTHEERLHHDIPDASFKGPF